MKTLFKSQDHQQQFEKEGFLKLSFLNSDEVEELKTFYHNQKFDNDEKSGFHVSLDNTDTKLVMDVSKKIRSILEPKSKTICDNAQIITASYAIKTSGLQNLIPPHQDWTFVDEPKYYSATVWIPLIDVSEENGAMGVIKGSHRIFDNPRPSPSPQSKSILADHIFTLVPYLEIIDMKAGEALIFDNRLIHASPPNVTKETRVAVGIGITQKEAQLVHYYEVPESNPKMLEKFEVDPDFFISHNRKVLSKLFDQGLSITDYKKVATLERKIPKLTTEEIEQKVMALDGVHYNKPLVEKLAKLFNYTIGEETSLKAKDIEKQTVSKLEHTDQRTFFQKYTPINIFKEVIWRLKGRP